jgi:hypothetical protein
MEWNERGGVLACVCLCAVHARSWLENDMRNECMSE